MDIGELKEKRLLEILSTMEVPQFRLSNCKGKPDILWLNRNLFIRNDEHPDIKEAYSLIKEIMFEMVQERSEILKKKTEPETVEKT